MVQVGSGSWWWRQALGVVIVARLTERWTEKEALFCSFFVLGLLLKVAGGVLGVGGGNLLCVVSKLLVVLCRKQGRYRLSSFSSELFFGWWQRKFPAVGGWRRMVAGSMLQGRCVSSWVCVFRLCFGWSPLGLQEEDVSLLIFWWRCCGMLLCSFHICRCIVKCRWWNGCYRTDWAWIRDVDAWWVRWLVEIWGRWLPWWVVGWCRGGVVSVGGSLVESEGWKWCSILQVVAVQNPGFGGSSRRLMEYVSVACSYGLRRCRVVSIGVRLHLACRDIRSYGSVFVLVAVVLATSQDLKGVRVFFRQKDWGVVRWVGVVFCCLGCVGYFLFVFVLLFVLVVIRLWSSLGCNCRD